MILETAKATQLKHLEVMLNLSRFLKKDWKSTAKEDIENLVVHVVKTYSSNGEETHLLYHILRRLAMLEMYLDGTIWQILQISLSLIMCQQLLLPLALLTKNISPDRHLDSAMKHTNH
jgi:hypothetical protein